MSTTLEAEQRARLAELYAEGTRIFASAAGRELTRTQAADLTRIVAEAKTLLPDERLDGFDSFASWATKINRPIPPEPVGSGTPRGFRDELGGVRVLGKSQKLADLVDRSAPGASIGLGQLLKGIVLGTWDGVDPEFKAQSVGLGTGGGFLVPEVLSANIIDRARAAAVVFAAGAQTVPMDSSELAIGRLSGGATTLWKSENAAIPAGDLTFERVTLRAKTLTALVKSSVELIEDAPDIGSVIENELGRALALELDRACIRGTGAANEPLGLRNQTGIGTTAVGGALTRYENISDAVRDVRAQNFEPDFLFLPPRTAGFFDKLADTTNQPLRPPASWDQLAKFPTTSIPTNLGAGADTELFVGVGSEMLVGVRTRLTIEASRQAAGSSGSAFEDLQIWIRAYLRADFALAHPAAFHALTGATS